MHQPPARRVGPFVRRWQSLTGCLAVASILSLSLIVYCVPLRASQGSKSPAAAPGGAIGRSKVTYNSAVEENILAAGGTLLKRPTLGSNDALRNRRPQPSLPRLRPGECGHGQCQNGSISPSDFVFAVASHDANEPALIAGRSGRIGIRTYISTNYTPSIERSYPAAADETWAFYPDDRQLRSFYEGDTRAALVPFLAYRDLGETFKWVFYGDDDTIFFLDAAMQLVKDLDPEMPYFLTDHFWYSNWNYGYPWHPHWRAPRCLPCFSDVDTSILRMDMVKACPCTPEDMCNLEEGYDGVLDKRMCSAPRAPTMTYSMHGGAGALISIGLLKKVSLSQMERCALQEWNTGGDSFITTCLWQAGYGMTDPGPLWHPAGLTRFDPSPRKLIYDTTPFIIPRAAFAIGNLVAKAAGACDSRCQLELDHFVSLHFRARLLTNTSRGAGALLRGVARFYNLNTGRLEEARARHSEPFDTEDAVSANLAAAIDANFTAGVERLKLLVPHMQVVSDAQARWRLDEVASLFMPTKTPMQLGRGGQEVELSREDLIRGMAAGIAHNVIEHALASILATYPPPRVEVEEAT